MWWLGLIACTPPTEPVEVDEARQALLQWERGDGDPERGWEVLLYGNFIGAGVPSELFFELATVLGPSSNVLERTGPSANLPTSFNLFDAPNGVEVVGGVTCMGCHGAFLQGSFNPGMGNAESNYTESNAPFLDLVTLAVRNRYGTDSPEYEAYLPFKKGGDAIAPKVITPFAGPNPAFSVERAAIANRDPVTLEWLDEPLFEVPELVMASDVPPWWNVKKKTHLYYTSMAGGNLPTLISQVSMVGLTDQAQFDQIAVDMIDLLAFIDQLEAPVYPGSIDAALAAEGQLVFESTCTRCHGTYGEAETYPELVVPFAEVGTDPLYGQAFGGEFGDWLAGSHMFDGLGAWRPSDGYVAPPLDGIWASGPYLHNGSVPDLPSLLESSTRPERWERLSGVDLERLGKAWRLPDEASDPVWITDTTLPSYGNGGHTYGDALSATDRGALLEYLKTL